MSLSLGSTAHILEYFKWHSSGPIPFCIQISSPNPGDHVVIVGGTHGNETAGVKAMVQLHQAFLSDDITLRQGKISFLLGNPQAYQQDVRYVNTDLNRAFDLLDASTVEGRRANEISAFLKSNNEIRVLLDLHSVSIGDFKILVYTREPQTNTDLSAAFSPIRLHFSFIPEHMPGTLIEAARRCSIYGLIVECGNHHGAHGVETAADHIHRILAHHHLIDPDLRSQIPPPAAITRYDSIQAIKPHANFRFLIKDIRTGTRLKKGQKFARDDQGYHISPQDCHVVVPSRLVKPTDYDAGFLATRTVLM
jgi:succinylglutamate desuccinylase